MDNKLDSYLLSKSTFSLSSIRRAKSKTSEIGVKKTTSTDPIPLKSGEILRTECGKFSFVCTYCEKICKNGDEIMDHINSHFDKVTSAAQENIEISEPLFAAPEFVSIDEVKQEPDMGRVKIEPTPQTTTRIVKILKRKRVIAPGVSKTSLEQRGNGQIIESTDNAKSPLTTRIIRIVKRKTINEHNVSEISCERRNREAGTPSSDKLKLSPEAVCERPSQEAIAMSSDKSKPSPDTKIIKIVKLKRIKPQYRLIATKKKALSDSDKTNSPANHENIKSPTEDKMGAAVELSSPLSIGSVPVNHENNKDPSGTAMELTIGEYSPVPIESVHQNIEHLFLKRRPCYQCEMIPRVYEANDPRRHICFFCPLWFPNHIEFQLHVGEIHKKNVDYVTCKDYYCYVCEKKFPFRQYLTAHLKWHTEDRLFLCATCGSSYKTKSRLSEHEKIHEGRLFECDQCGKTFSRFVSYRRHLWCHNTNSPFTCKVCSKSFRSKIYLNKHMALHREPKIPCRHCDATFHFVSVRRAHEQSRHNVL